MFNPADRRESSAMALISAFPTFAPTPWRNGVGVARRLFLAAEPYPIARLRPLQSNAIAAARVFCILGIIYVHAWTGRTTLFLIQNSDTAQGLFRWLLVETIGRSSVPLLGVISGWLVAESALRRNYRQFMTGKARTILAPMLLWNALSVVFVCGAAWLGWLSAPMPDDIGWVIDEILSYASFNVINVQNTFLRDLFMCMAVAPLLVRLQSRWLAILGGAVAIWIVAGLWCPLFLRPQIPLFFLLGILARRHGIAEQVEAMPFSYAALPFAVMAPVKLAISIWGFEFTQDNMELVAAADTVTRVAAALLAWRTAIAIARHPFMALFARIEPYTFFLFCSHMILIWLGGQTLGRFSGPLGAPSYPLFLLIQPALALIAAIALGQLLLQTAPGVAKLLSGGRLRAIPLGRPSLAAASA